MMTNLIKYDAARKALQAAHNVDEVRQIKDKAEAVRAYARQAGDTEMQSWAEEIWIGKWITKKYGSHFAHHGDVINLAYEKINAGANDQ